MKNHFLTLFNMTDEELKALEEKAALADKLQGERDELNQALEDERKKREEIEGEEKLINFRRMRKANENMKRKIEAGGFEVDEETGEIKERADKISPDDVRRIAGEEAERKMIEKSLLKAQQSLNDEDKQTFQRYYAKATHGESVTSDNVDEFITMTMNMAGKATRSDNESARSAATRGGVPKFEEREKSFADTDPGKEVYNKMFGK